MNVLKKIKNIPQEVLLLIIRIYQRLFSFDHSFWARPDRFRVCLHYPSCSEYAHIAIRKHGVIKGGLMGLFRVLRCTPFTKHRIDYVPDSFSIRANPPKKD